VNKPLIRKRSPWDLGTWLWLLNRIAGVAIIVYLCVHILVIGSTRGGADAFNGVMNSLHSPFSLFLELVLILAIVAHGVNGLRHIAIDFGFASPVEHKKLFMIAAGVGGFIALVALLVAMPGICGA